MATIAVNPHVTLPVTREAPALSLFAITKSDVDELTTVVRAIYVGTTGDVTVIDTAGNTVLHKAVPAGAYIGPFLVKQVKSTGTSAADMVGYV